MERFKLLFRKNQRLLITIVTFLTIVLTLPSTVMLYRSFMSYSEHLNRQYAARVSDLYVTRTIRVFNEMKSIANTLSAVFNTEILGSDGVKYIQTLQFQSDILERSEAINTIRVAYFQGTDAVVTCIRKDAEPIITNEPSELFNDFDMDSLPKNSYRMTVGSGRDPSVPEEYVVTLLQTIYDKDGMLLAIIGIDVLGEIFTDLTRISDNFQYSIVMTDAVHDLVSYNLRGTIELEGLEEILAELRDGTLLGDPPPVLKSLDIVYVHTHPITFTNLDVWHFYVLLPSSYEVAMLNSIISTMVLCIVITIIGSMLKSYIFTDAYKLGYIDRLTGSYNKHFYQDQVQGILNSARGEVSSASLAVIDLDNFKHVNDTYGHQNGDIVLCRLASLLKSVLRKSDFIIRFGGDEFILLLPDTDPEVAIIVLERIRMRVEKEDIFTQEGTVVNITISVGVASTSAEKSTSLEVIMNKADKMLYIAKTQGRNQVVYKED